MKKENAKVLLVAVAMATFAGCTPVRKGPAPVYSRDELISKAQKNMENLDQFRAKGGRLSGQIPTDKGKIRHYDLDGVTVRYEGPRNLYLSGNMLGSPALIIGSNPEKYWLGVLTDPSRLHWGYWKFAEHEANPWRMGGPVRLMEALGRIKFRNEGGADTHPLAGPVLHREDNENLLLYFASDETGNFYTAKEIYLSRYDPIVVEKIVYYLPNGKPELIIEFSDHKQVSGGGIMAHKIQMTWPAENSSMKLSLGKVTLGEKAPANAFAMPELSSFQEVEQVDAACK